MSDGIPIYVRSSPVRLLGFRGRLVAASIALICLAVLMTAAWLTPDPHGMGTHQQLGLRPCGMMEQFGLPCPTCGYTTSFSLFVRGRLLSSAINQPGGFATAGLTGIAFWLGVYVAWTGKPLHRLAGRYFTSTLVFGVGLFYLFAWGWKIVLTRAAS
jgi:hypothetical protein